MLVNFLIIGSQKAATSALAKFLSQHPEIYMGTKKEAHFFNHPEKFHHLSKEQMAELYHNNFPDPGNATFIGEATPAYMFLPYIPKLIFEYNPGMKIICLLRDPVERAWSQYLMERNRGFEKNTFWKSIIREFVKYFNDKDNYSLLNKNKPVRRFCYIERGLYSKQIQKWIKYFPESQFLILRTKDLLLHHEATLKMVYRFLNINNVEYIPEQEIVFRTNSYRKIDLFSECLLNLYYFREKKRLKLLYNITEL